MSTVTQHLTRHVKKKTLIKGYVSQKFCFFVKMNFS